MSSKLEREVRRPSSGVFASSNGHSEPPAPVQSDVARLVHELSVHQVELEAENEDLKRAVERGKLLYERYQELYQRAPIACIAVDGSFALLEANEMAARLFGRPWNELSGARLSALLEPESVALLQAQIEIAIRNTASTSCELYVRCSNHQTKLAHAQITAAMFSSHAKPRASTWSSRASTYHAAAATRQVYIILTDLTDQIRLSEEIEKRRAILQGMFNAAVDGIIVAEAEGRILDANPRAEAMFGFPCNTLRELEVNITHLVRFTDQASPRSQDWLLAGEREQIRIGRPLEAEGLRRNNSRFPLQLSISSFTAGHQKHLVAVYVRDVTVQRELERQLAQAHKMEAIGRLASGIAHDFNNILTGIMGCAELALREAPADAPTAKLMNDLIANTERGAGLARQLLDFGSRRKRTMSTVDLGHIVQHAEGLLRRVIPSSISLQLNSEAGDNRIVAETAQIHQILLNLALNARDAMPGGGELEVSASALDFSSRLDRRQKSGLYPISERRHIIIPEGQYVVLRVRDNGTGMDADTQRRVFEPFFTTKDQAHGLGLATVFGIVKRLGGYVDLQSAPGTGSCFTFYLPRAQTEDARTSTVPPKPHLPGLGLTTAAAKPAMVLLIEDEPLVLHTTQRFLEHMGCRTLTAANGREAIAISADFEGEIDLVLSDVVMPEMGGREATERLLQQRPRLRVLFMSANDAADLTQRGLLPAAAFFLQKPFSSAALAAWIDHIMSDPHV